MSQYIPRKFVAAELAMQQKRREHGLKTGHYSKWPDKEKGPYIVLTHKIEQLDRLNATSIMNEAIKEGKNET